MIRVGTCGTTAPPNTPCADCSYTVTGRQLSRGDGSAGDEAVRWHLTDNGLYVIFNETMQLYRVAAVTRPSMDLRMAAFDDDDNVYQKFTVS